LKVVFLASDDWYFWAHRLPLARAVREQGAQVIVMTVAGAKCAALASEGFGIIPWGVSRGSLNPLRELWAFLQVIRAYRRVRPDLVHHVGLKPIMHGGTAARLCGPIPSVNTFAGLGTVFASNGLKMRSLRCLVLRILAMALRVGPARSVFENFDDRKLLVDAGVMPSASTVVIRGAGVNVSEFSPQPEPPGPPLVILPSRMLWTKGLGEYVEAAKLLRRRGSNARFALVGATDPENPLAVPESRLIAWAESGTVEWWKHQADMPGIYAQSHVVCLPSYGEGIPRSLLEAAACGRAAITTDVPGCREVVRHGENGLLVPPRDPGALAEAIATLLADPDLRARMGARGREIAVQEFSDKKVVQETLAVYRNLLGERWTEPAGESLDSKG
jgi:glycosyltransferase involved in cell wall biosynthesis